MPVTFPLMFPTVPTFQQGAAPQTIPTLPPLIFAQGGASPQTIPPPSIPPLLVVL